jgi:hypothetical protein
MILLRRPSLPNDIAQYINVYCAAKPAAVRWTLQLLQLAAGEEACFVIEITLGVGVIKSRRLRWAGHVARMVERRGVYRGLLGKPEGKRSLGRPRHRWEDNIKIALQEARCGGMNWIELAQDRDRWQALVCAVMNLQVP